MSLGLPAELGGVGRFGEPPIHAVGVDPVHGVMYEVTRDQRYTGRARPLRFLLPDGYYCASWDPWRAHFRVLPVGAPGFPLDEEALCRLRVQALGDLWG